MVHDHTEPAHTGNAPSAEGPSSEGATEAFSAVDLEKLAHDIKTPLATIRALTQLTVTQLRKKGEDATADRLSKVDTQVERIRTLLQEALSASNRGEAEE